MLDKSLITVNGGTGNLDGVTQGTGVHLLNATIRLDDNAWRQTFISDGGADINFDDNDGNQVLSTPGGSQIINGVSYPNGTVVEAEYRLTLQDPNTGQTWDVIAYNVRNALPGFQSYATIEGLAFVGPVGGFPPIGVDLVVIANYEGPGDAGQPAIPAGNLASPPCFGAGTLIDTPKGRVAVEVLAAGDMVFDADDQPKPLRAVLKRTLDAAALRANPKLRPVRITAGALGMGLPERDLWVSRQHRMVVRSRIAKKMFASDEVLVAAIRLTAMPGIFVDETIASVTYVHLIFDEHVLLRAEGAPSESLFFGPEAARMLDQPCYRETLAIFPALLSENLCQCAARPIPTALDQKILLSRHAAHRVPILESCPDLS